MPRVVIVGAGPAGIAAAAAVAHSTLDIMLIDEARRPGGQVHRSPAPGLALDMRRLLGTGLGAYERFHALANVVCARVDYRPETTVWSVHGGAVHLSHGAGIETLPYDALILAPGATDRVMPMPGWTQPGIFTLGAAQALLKDQGCLIGRRVVFCGSSPLLYVAALQYLRVGGEVAAVLDTTAFADKLIAVPRMLAASGTLRDGLLCLAALRRRSVPVLHGVRLERFVGGEAVSAVVYRRASGSVGRTDCDAVAYGHGLRPETQLAELAGCTLRYDPLRRLHVPDTDGDGRAGQGVYVAGDGGVIGGAEAAAVSGRLAGRALLHDLGLHPVDAEAAADRRRLRRLRRFQDGLATAFRWPAELAGALDDFVILCRCENVAVGEVRAALEQPIGSAETNRVKAATRCGMGRCQGRYCGPALAELVAALAGRTAEELGHLRAQAPVKPLPIGIAADQRP